MCIASNVDGTIREGARGSIESDVLNACKSYFVLMYIRLAHQAPPFSQSHHPLMRRHLRARLHSIYHYAFARQSRLVIGRTHAHAGPNSCTGYILDGGQYGNGWLAYWLEITCEFSYKKWIY